MTKYNIVRIGEEHSHEWVVIATQDNGSRSPISKHATEVEASSEAAWLSAQALTEGQVQ